MTAFSAGMELSTSSLASFSVDGLADGIEAGHIPGLKTQDPLVAALMCVLQDIGWSGPTRQLVQALPHWPDQFTTSDLRSILARVGVFTRTSKITSVRLNDLPYPAVLIDDRRRVRVVGLSLSGQKTLKDPITGATDHSPLRGQGTLISLSKPFSNPSESFTFELFRRFAGDALPLFGAKAVMYGVTLAVAISILLIFDSMIPGRSTDAVVMLGVGVALVIAIDVFFRFCKAVLTSRISARMEFLVASRVFRRILLLPFEKQVVGTTAQQVSRMRQFNAIPKTLSGPILEVVLELPFALCLVILLVAIVGPIGLIPVAVVLAFVAAAALWLPRIRRLEALAQRARDEYEQTMHDLVLHAAQIKSMGAQDVWRERADKMVRRQAATQRAADIAHRVLHTIASMATPFAGGTTAILGAWLVMQGQLPTGAFLATIILIWRVIAPIQALSMLATKWTEFRRLSQQLDRLMTLPDETDETDSTPRPEIKGHITCEGLAYRYPGANGFALRGVSIDLPAGTLAAVTGGSGAGKTTLLRTIPALVRPTAGVVMLDGHNINQFQVTQLRDEISYLPYSPILVHGTIAQNLRLARPLASESEILDVLDEVGLANVVSNLPEGAGTRMSEDIKAGLPMGFQQAVCLAQALIRRPKILLLDEPAQSLDHDLEAAMMAALVRRKGTTTTLMVTHRPSHIRAADIEIKLQAGMVRDVSDLRKDAT